MEEEGKGEDAKRVFPTTRWTLVFQVREGGPEAQQRALDELCQHYWMPIYAFIRRKGHSVEESEDLTQGFFERMIAGERFGLADAAQGKLRSFLLTIVTRYLHTEWRKETAQKRGGGERKLSIDTAAIEPLLVAGGLDGLTPEKLYDRTWALTLINSIHEKLRSEYGARGKAEDFAVLSEFLAGAAGERRYTAVGEELGMSEDAVKQSVRRMRLRFRRLLREQLSYTAETEAEVDEELQALFSSFR